MTDRPTITVQRHIHAIHEQRLCDPEPVMATPELHLEITYPLGEHGQALAALEDTVANIRRQILDAAETGAPR